MNNIHSYLNDPGLITERITERLLDQFGGANAKIDELESSIAALRIELHEGFIRQMLDHVTKMPVIGTEHEIALASEHTLFIHKLLC